MLLGLFVLLSIAFFLLLVLNGSRRPPTLRPLTPEQLDAFRRRMERS